MNFAMNIVAFIALVLVFRLFFIDDITDFILFIIGIFKKKKETEFIQDPETSNDSLDVDEVIQERSKKAKEVYKKYEKAINAAINNLVDADRSEVHLDSEDNILFKLDNIITVLNAKGYSVEYDKARNTLIISIEGEEE